MSPAPVGIKQIQDLYGDPDPYIREDGTPSPLWAVRMVVVKFPEPLPLGWNKSKVATGARVNNAIADEVDRAFRLLSREGLWPRFRTYDGGFVWRPQRGSSSTLSMHAYGAALDFNAETNQLGKTGDMDPGVVQMFDACGWTWGGRWKRPDPMHFQFGRE